MRSEQILEPNTIKVLSFDLDDTLWPIEPTIKRAEEESWLYMLKQYPSIARQYRPKDVVRTRQEVQRDFPHLQHDLTFQRKESIRRLLIGSGYDESSVDELFMVYFTWRNQVQFFSDVVTCMNRLNSRFRIIGLTNGNADLKMTGLNQWLETIIYAREIGKAKPHKAMFDALLEAADCDIHEIVHIGDHLQDDILGALQYGIRAVWLNRFNQEVPLDLPVEIKVIGELAPLCEALNV